MQSFYRHGSNGRVNLFSRPDGRWVIQWEGSPEHDSGYMAYEFEKECAAQAAFDEMKGEEDMRQR